MRRSPLAAGALLAALLVGAAAGGSIRSATAPAPLTAVAFDGSRIAFADAFSASDCTRVRIWNTATRLVTRLGRRTSCVTTSTGTAIPSVAVARDRALWLHYTGGNIREWSVWTATPGRRLPRRLAFATADADGPAPIVLGNGDASRFGGLLPYAVGRTVTVLRVDGSRRFRWTAPRRVAALAARDGAVAVASTGGLVTVLDADGAVLRTESYDGEVTAVSLTGTAMVVQIGRRLELRPSGETSSFPLPAGARLADALGPYAVYVARNGARLLDLATARDRRLAPGTQAALDSGRAAVANGRRVLLVPL